MGRARVDELIAALPGWAWSRISCGPGAHGPREYWGARVPIRVFWRPGRGHCLLARRNMSTGVLAYYVCTGCQGHRDRGAAASVDGVAPAGRPTAVHAAGPSGVGGVGASAAS